MNYSAIDNLPLQQANIGAFVLWILFGLINSLFSIWNIAVLKTCKSLTNITLCLVIQISAVEGVAGVANAIIGSYHLFYIHRQYPETNSTLNCFLIGGISYMFFVSALAFLYLALSVDRFFICLLSGVYRNSSSKFKRVFYLLSYGTPCLICTLGFLDVSSTQYTPLCILRESLSKFGFLLFTYSMLTASILSVLMYGILIVVKIKLRQNQMSVGGNVAQVTAKINSKVTKALAGNAVVHLVTFTLAAFGNAMVTFCSNKGSYLGSYFVPFYYMGSVTSFIMYYNFQQQFRCGCKNLARRIFQKKPQMNNLTNNNNQTLFTLIKTSQIVAHANAYQPQTINVRCNYVQQLSEM